MRLLQRSALSTAIHTYYLPEKYKQATAKLKKIGFFLEPNFARKLVLEVSCGFVRQAQIHVRCSAANIKGTVKKESLCMG